jgi:UDP-N-acetylmuramoyl-tripeptide--D-alanyl-D-alanine ligase
VGRGAALSVDEIATGLASGWSAPHRVAIVRIGGVTVIDDAYNASPRSVESALDLLAGLPGRRIAVLGQMLELGAASEAGHREVGEAAAATVERLVVVGRAATLIAEGTRTAGLNPNRVHIVSDTEAAVDLLAPRLRDGDVVLVKASRGAALERVVEGLRRELGHGPRQESRR